MKKNFFILTIVIFIITACEASNIAPTLDFSAIQTSITQTRILPSVTPTYTPTLNITITFMLTSSPTVTPDMRLTAHYWREWPIVPELSLHAQNILRQALKNSNLDPHVFSKVGDCQMTSGTFLGGYANDKYAIPEGYENTVKWFSESMLAESVTAEKGLGISSVLNPMFGLGAGYKQCNRNETPLDCELRTRRPIIVLIGMGTNWIPNADASFEKYLREVVDRILEIGALPILATKGDNVEGDWRLNLAIAQVAYDYDLPLVNVWRSVKDLPGRGIERKIYLTPDGWMRRNYAWLVTLDRVRELLKK
jgi:hypothetical protein